MQQQIFDQINSQFSSMLENSPFKDMEKNTKTIIMSIFSKLDLVTREEFDTQQKVLIATRKKLEELEELVKTLTH
jgi:ubiquinone biosynthesis accessory factor UbiK